MVAAPFTTTPFCCPHCRTPVDIPAHEGGDCEACGAPLPLIAGGAPALIRDLASVQEHLSVARSGPAAAWYEDPQVPTTFGAYRHHLSKRRDYLTSILQEFRASRGASSIVGLDLGCGDGSNVEFLRHFVDELYASDFNPLRLERTAAAFPDVPVVLADITDYPAADDSFDLVFFNHVLEHIPDDHAALREVYRILIPGGLCIIGTPNEGAAWWQLAYRLQPESLAASDHVHFYKLPELQDLCHRAGFRVQSSTRLGWGLPHWSLDAKVRGYKVMDDLLDAVGRRLFREQASSLYVILTKD